jgi:hypothetical protein
MQAVFGMDVRLGAAAVGAALVLSAAAPASGEPATQPGATARRLNSDLVNLPPNTWVRLTPNRNPEGF